MLLFALILVLFLSIKNNYLEPSSWNVSSYFLIPGIGFVLSSVQFKRASTIYGLLLLIITLGIYLIIDANVLTFCFLISISFPIALSALQNLKKTFFKHIIRLDIIGEVYRQMYSRSNPKLLTMLVLSIFIIVIPLLIISRFDGFRITGGRELIWYGYLEPANLLYRPIIDPSNINPQRIAALIGSPSSFLYYPTGDYVNTFRYNCHSMLVCTIGKYGYIFGFFSLCLVFSYFQRLFAYSSISNIQRGYLFALFGLALLNGKGLYTSDDFTFFFNISMLALFFVSRPPVERAYEGQS
jgi:hypothetical protein